MSGPEGSLNIHVSGEIVKFTYEHLVHMSKSEQFCHQVWTFFCMAFHTAAVGLKLITSLFLP